MPKMIEQIFRAYTVERIDIESLYRTCSDVARGSLKYAVSEWQDWMLAAFDVVYPGCDHELMPKLIRAGFFCSNSDQQFSPESTAIKFAQFLLLVSRATHNQKLACYINHDP